MQFTIQKRAAMIAAGVVALIVLTAVGCTERAPQPVAYQQAAQPVVYQQAPQQAVAPAPAAPVQQPVVVQQQSGVGDMLLGGAVGGALGYMAGRSSAAPPTQQAPRVVKEVHYVQAPAGAPKPAMPAPTYTPPKPTVAPTYTPPKPTAPSYAPPRATPAPSYNPPARPIYSAPSGKR